jgi:hypothetical protein
LANRLRFDDIEFHKYFQKSAGLTGHQQAADRPEEHLRNGNHPTGQIFGNGRKQYVGNQKSSRSPTLTA